MTTTPSITVYVPVDKQTEWQVHQWNGVTKRWHPIERVAEQTIPDPSYIHAIISDPTSAIDKIQRLQIYLDTFDNLTKY